MDFSVARLAFPGFGIAGAMPPKAGAADLKHDDIKAGTEFMLSAAK